MRTSTALFEHLVAKPDDVVLHLFAVDELERNDALGRGEIGSPKEGTGADPAHQGRMDEEADLGDQAGPKENAVESAAAVDPDDFNPVSCVELLKAETQIDMVVAGGDCGDVPFR